MAYHVKANLRSGCASGTRLWLPLIVSICPGAPRPLTADGCYGVPGSRHYLQGCGGRNKQLLAPPQSAWQVGLIRPLGFTSRAGSPPAHLHRVFSARRAAPSLPARCLLPLMQKGDLLLLPSCRARPPYLLHGMAPGCISLLLRHEVLHHALLLRLRSAPCLCTTPFRRLRRHRPRPPPTISAETFSSTAPRAPSCAPLRHFTEMAYQTAQ